MIIWTFRIQKLKIGSLADFEKKSFSSLFLMRKPLSSDQKWFLRPYFPLIGGIFVLKSGLRFLFRALEVPIRKVRKRPFLRRGVRSDAQLSSTETRFQKCSQSGKNGSKHPMLSISMAYNVISCKKVERNTQKLKIADFTM